MMATALFATSVARAVSQPVAEDSGGAIAPCLAENAPSGGAPAAPPGREKTRRPAVPDWELTELTSQAETHNQRIVESEMSVLDDYWMLGRLLERMRGNFRHGAWQPWLDRRQIDRTRAKRARLLAQMFTSAEELRGLTLHQALAIARERKKALGGGPRETTLQKQFKSAMKKLLDIAGGFALAEVESRQYSPLATDVAVAAALICRTCQSPLAPPETISTA
jgi:hypothetical protein